MGIVDHHQRPIAAAEALHTTGDRLQLRGDRQQRLQVISQHQQAGQCRQGVGDVETAQQRNAQLTRPPGRIDLGRETPIVEGEPSHLDKTATTGCHAGIQRVGHGIGHLAQPDLSHGIVAVQHAVPGRQAAEQGALGGRIGFHGAVVIQMIPAEIGKRRHREGQRRHPPLHQAVGGDLHGHQIGALSQLPGQLLLDGECTGGGIFAGGQLTK